MILLSEESFSERLNDGGERRFGDVRGHGGDGIDACGSDGGVGVPEPADKIGEHFREEGRESIPVGLRENSEESDALFPDRRLVGGVRLVNA